jgi:hypothetical protein
MKRRAITEEEKAIAERLKKVWLSRKAELGLTQEIAATRMGWKSQGTVGQYLNAKLPLNTDAKIKFAELLNCDVTEIDPGFQAVTSEQPTLPLISLEQAAKWVPLNQPYPDEFVTRVLKPSASPLGSRAYVIDIGDESMSLLAPKGSQVAIDPDCPPEHGKMAVYHLPEHGETYLGLYMSRAGKETLKFLDGTDSISLDGASFCGKARILLAREL